MPRHTRLTTFLLLILFLAGCGGGMESGNVIVRGKVFKDGKPLTVANQDIGVGRIEVYLIPQFEDAEEEVALASPDGTFVFTGAGRGISSGTYKIAVYALEPGERGADVDRLQGAFSKKRTPIVREIGAMNSDLGIIELGEPTK